MEANSFHVGFIPPKGLRDKPISVLLMEPYTRGAAGGGGGERGVVKELFHSAYLFFRGGKTEAQRGKMICQLHSWN